MSRPPIVLAYHGIRDVPAPLDPARLFISPETLRSQVSRLHARGYEFLHMREFARRLAESGPPEGACALTFDDGTEDHLTTLPGVLAEFDAPATVYVCRDLMGKPYPWVDPQVDVRLMTSEEVVELSSNPLFEIGSHTNGHTVLEHAGEAEALREMSASKEYLEELLGVEVPSFCYPRCLFSAACPPASERAGHTSAVTCEHRGSWAPHELKRAMMLKPDGRLTFELKSRGRFYGIRNTAPARLARWATRRHRHRAERG